MIRVAVARDEGYFGVPVRALLEAHPDLHYIGTVPFDSELPQAAARPVDTQDTETLVVAITRKGEYYLDDRKITEEALHQRVSAILRLRPKTPVLVRGDRFEVVRERETLEDLVRGERIPEDLLE